MSEEACLVSFRARLPRILTSELLPCLGALIADPLDTRAWPHVRPLEEIVFGPDHYPAIQGDGWGPAGSPPVNRAPYYLSPRAYREVYRAAIAMIVVEIDLRFPPRLGAAS